MEKDPPCKNGPKSDKKVTKNGQKNDQKLSNVDQIQAKDID